MSQQIPPNNSDIPQGDASQGNTSHDNVPHEGGMVLAGGHADASPRYIPQSAGPAQYSQYWGGGSPSSYGPQNYSRNRAPMIDPIESAKLTPQLLILLVFAGLRRHWKWSLPMGALLGVFAGAVFYAAFPVQFASNAQIQIQAFPPQFIEMTTRQHGRHEDFVNTQLALLRHPHVIDRALENPEVARLPIVLRQTDKRDWLTRTLRVNHVARSEIVRVGIATDTADASERIVNAVVDAYLNFIGDVARETNNNLISQLRVEERRQRQQAQAHQESIRRAARSAARLGAEAGTGGESGEMGHGLAQGVSLERDIALADTRLTTMRSQRRAIIERMNRPDMVPISLLMRMNPETQAINDRREILIQQRESRAQFLPDPSSDLRIIEMDRQIENLDTRLEELATGVDGSGLETMQHSFRFQEEVNLFNLDQEIRTQEILVEELVSKHNEQLLRSVERAENVLDASFEQAQLSRANNVLNQIEDRILALQTETRAPGRISLLSRATSSTPSRARQIMLIGGGAAALAFFPLLLSIAVERMKPRLYHVSQVRRGIPHVLIGEIMEPPVSWIHGATFRKRLARYRESVHNWCTHLLLSDPFRSCRTLSVASVAGDDGKTFLAVQIAVAMSQMRAGKVLLIDGDMRVGRLHLLFGNEETGVGLADVLSFRNLPGEAIVQNEKEPNLELLSAGQLDMSPYELLGDGRFRELLDALEQSPTNPGGYSLIIVVLPPVANAAESLIMAASTDSTLLCVRQGETVLAAMEDVYRKLVNTGASVDGIVVKDIPYYQMAGRDGGFTDRLEQVRLSHLLQYAD